MLAGAQKKFYRIQHPEIYLLDLKVQYKLACVAGGIRGHKGEAWNTACPKTKHFEFSGSWVTERSDWLEYRFEFMIDKKLLLVFI